MTGSVTVGLDVGGTKCLGLAVDRDGRIAAERRIETPGGEDGLVEALADLALRLGTDVGLPLAGVGVGAAGLVSRDGVLRFAPNLPGVVELPLRTALEERLGVPVQVDNDATCAAWGERQWGAARGLDDVVLVTLGTGIGGGLITGGSLHRGANGFAGEVGHMVVDPHGPPCPCGQRGCWERFASGSGLARLGREAAMAHRAPAILALAGGDPEQVRGEHVSAAAAEGDEGAQAVLERFAGWVALGLVNLTNVFDPEAIVIGGGLVEMGDLLFDPLKTSFRGTVFAAGHREPVRIIAAALGARAGAIGAAALAIDAGREPTAAQGD